MRICLVYDCLYPHTVGGAERWYRALAEGLAGAGHEVTYLTRRQWPRGERPDGPAGTSVVVVAPGGPLYTASGRRRIGPPLRFGLGVMRYLATHRSAHDAVHLCSFPYFPLLAARATLAGTGTSIAVDWFEVWTRGYWRAYLGPLGGAIGELVQWLCVQATGQAFVFSDLHARRLTDAGLRSTPVRLGGLYGGDSGATPHPQPPDPPVAVYAGRHIPEKQVTTLPAAIAAARERIPNLRGVILGDGPERGAVLASIAHEGLTGVIDAPGFVPAPDVAATLANATCLVLPSAREGYGLVVIEAAAAGTPSVVAAGPDNAATELIEPGRNGVIARSARPADLAGAIAACVDGGATLRANTASWFARHAPRLTVEASLERVLEAYRG